MGNRYILTVTCPECGHVGKDVWFAPTCEYDDWECPSCGRVVDLCEYTGISYEDASNASEIEFIIGTFEGLWGEKDADEG